MASGFLSGYTAHNFWAFAEPDNTFFTFADDVMLYRNTTVFENIFKL